MAEQQLQLRPSCLPAQRHSFHCDSVYRCERFSRVVTSDAFRLRCGWTCPTPACGFSSDAIGRAAGKATGVLRSGEGAVLQCDSASAVFHIVKGAVQAEIAGEALPTAEDADVVEAPAHASVRLANGAGTKPAFLFQIDDEPLHSKIGIYERFAARAPA